jgi:hypothetical protein
VSILNVSIVYEYTFHFTLQNVYEDEDGARVSAQWGGQQGLLIIVIVNLFLGLPCEMKSTLLNG